jgi:AP2 domain
MGRIPLRARDGSVRAWALVDDADFAWLNQWRWCLDSDGYAVRTTPRKVGKRTIRMHRQILGLERGDPRQGDHKNRNKFDCRRSNLRIAERGQADNQQNHATHANNKSGYRGVSYDKGRSKWMACVKLKDRTHNLGRFDTAEEADATVKAFRAEHMPFSEDAALAAR